jgi:hypothetical protein
VHYQSSGIDFIYLEAILTVLSKYISLENVMCDVSCTFNTKAYLGTPHIHHKERGHLPHFDRKRRLSAKNVFKNRGMLTLTILSIISLFTFLS